MTVMSLVEVSGMSFYYPRARLGANNEGWTLKDISLDVRAPINPRRRW